MHLLGLQDLSRDDILQITNFATHFHPPADRPYLPPEPYRDALMRQPVALLFFEPSTRTRASFELAVHHLGGYPLALPLATSSLVKGETALDTCLNLQAMGVRGFIVRHKEASVLEELTTHLNVPVINAGAGADEHPSQGLLDIRTLQEALACRLFDGVKIAIVGDIRHSRVARSDVIGLKKLGASIRIAAPKSLLPDVDDPAFEGVERFEARDEAIEGADALIVLRIQKERFDASSLDLQSYVDQWQINRDAVSKLAPHAPILHPGPVVRGEEMTPEVIDGPSSQILKQVGWGVAVRQAILYRHLCREVCDATLRP